MSFRFGLAFLPVSNHLLISHGCSHYPASDFGAQESKRYKVGIEIMFSKVSNENFRVENYNTGKNSLEVVSSQVEATDEKASKSNIDFNKIIESKEYKYKRIKRNEHKGSKLWDIKPTQ